MALRHCHGDVLVHTEVLLVAHARDLDAFHNVVQGSSVMLEIVGCPVVIGLEVVDSNAKVN